MSRPALSVSFTGSLLFRTVVLLSIWGFALFVLSSLLYLAWQEHLTSKRLVEHGRSYMEMLIENSADSISKGQRQSFQRVIDSFTAVDDVDAVSMYERNRGLENYRSGESTVGLPFVRDEGGDFVNPNREIYERSRGRHVRPDWHVRDVIHTSSAREHIAEKERQSESCAECHFQMDPELEFEGGFAWDLERQQSHFYYRLPVTDDCMSCHTNWDAGETASWMRITLSNAALLEQKRENILGILFISTIVLFPALLVVIYIIRRVINRPLRDTLHFAQAVAEGRRSEKIPVHGENEISQLNAALNQMMETINRDFARIQDAESRLRQQAQTDGLTGIANRRYLDECLEVEISRLSRHAGQLSLVLLDIDYFKGFNDTYGHQAGDDCLRRLARLLQSCLGRTTDLAARYGGEEFVCVLPQVDLAGACTVAQRIQRALEDEQIPNEASDVSSWVTASMGIVTLVCDPALSPAQLLQWADEQLYRAKDAGRNCIEATERDPADML